MTRRRRVGVLLAVAAVGTAAAAMSGRVREVVERVRGISRRVRGISGRIREMASGRTEPGGRLISGVRGYDAWSSAFLGRLFRRIAGEIAAVSNPGDTLLWPWRLVLVERIELSKARPHA